MQKKIWKTTFLLWALTLLVFFIVQFFLRDQSYFQFSDFQYILSTSIANAFVITTIYALVAAYNLVQSGKKEKLGFGSVFKLSFLPTAMASVLSLAVIYAYFYYIDSSGIEQIKTEYLDYSLYQAEGTENYEKTAEIVNSKEIRSTNLLSYRTLTLMLGGYLFFSLSLALMMSFLWKIRNTPARK